ncbi:angiopoietin-1-like isoform X1 [Sinocyclocheilus anshuiensis]|uniref:angiopoietin-1-like isoform X1 n=1 Tax=Sinocyclocheilus anshuiensis TaxID=1608454 RepID=UPI0007B81983|nr:PREDICTED: angiopoietin-1-like isoform X1 [Sinocyclocheilus anshuiensis]XP_016339553.1 PREDICTED: angiopoietin-1-like isoform X1 [Sinocyclocheilus anshuiensis]
MKIDILLHLMLLLVRTSSIEDSPVDTFLVDVSGGSSQHLNSVQHGECSYTFILPEHEESRTGSWPEEHDGNYEGNSVQKESPQGKQSCLNQRIQHLELAMENYTHWVQKIEVFVKESLTEDTTHLRNNALHSEMTAMLDLGTKLHSLSTQHIRRLTDMETQVLNQTSRLEIQSLENSLSSIKLENKLLRQTSEINQLRDKTDALEQRMRNMEARHRAELGWIKSEWTKLQRFLVSQSSSIQNLELNLEQVITNNSALYREQLQLHSTINNLLKMCPKNKAVSPKDFKQMDEQRKYRDCAELFRAGFNRSGIYTIYISMQDMHKVYCNMESAGGGWTVIQLRKDGTLDFHRTWKEYKMGFGSLTEEHWLGNELVYKLTNQRQCTLRLELTDWDGKLAFSQYDKFYLGSEKQNYRLFLKSYSGTAGRQSSLVINGADFSTKDMDNDNCICKCALMLTGGWWFDACGPSNLNGIYYTSGQNSGKLDGIKWHYFKGPNYSLHATTMMIRPLDF